MEIRDERPEDGDAIRATIAAAFGQADEAELVERLRRDGDLAISLVALEGGRVVGHVALSRMVAPARALGLGPVAVAPDRQRRGIGSLLIRAGLARAVRDGWRGAVVLGEPEFYRRFGFDPARAARFESPYAGPYLMAMPLAGDMPDRGPAEYAPAFAALG